VIASAARLLIAGGLVVIACQNATSSVPATVPPGPVMEQVRAVLARDEQKWIDFRRDLHRHPELSGAEARTSERVAAELRRLGLQVRTSIGGYGVVGILRGARSGPLIAYRADMDAFPSSAPDPVDFLSLNPGVRHICGHDIHTTVALALATALRQVRDSLAGSVMFVFQPAEERATGAKAMLADGVFASDRPNEIYGIHTSAYEAGRVGTTPGPLMAGRDRFDVLLSGSGDLEAAAALVAQRIDALSTMDVSQVAVSQPPDFVLIQRNPFVSSAGQVRVSGTVTVASATSRARVQGAIQSGLASAVPAGVNVAATYEAKLIAGVTNDSSLTASATVAMRSALGDPAVAKVTLIPPRFSEDFGSFQERVPGVFFFLGVANAARGWNGFPHDPAYVADERAITVGAVAMAAVIVNRLRVQ
jgi:metal-dependent amidase/aminoacylase/carboxypeptidase family protein